MKSRRLFHRDFIYLSEKNQKRNKLDQKLNYGEKSGIINNYVMKNLRSNKGVFAI